MVVVLKQVGTTLWLRESLNMEVRTSASSFAHALSARPGMLSGPNAFRGLILLRALCTWLSATVEGGERC